MTNTKLKIPLFLAVVLMAVLLIRGQPRSEEQLETAQSRAIGDEVTTGFWSSEAEPAAMRDTQLAKVSINAGGAIYQQSENYRAGLSSAQFVAQTSRDPCTGIDIGNANGSTTEPTIDIDDVVYLIAYIFSGGPAPVPYAEASGDANCSCVEPAVDIDDVVYLIAFIFSGGPPPCTCEEWVAACGPLH